MGQRLAKAKISKHNAPQPIPNAKDALLALDLMTQFARDDSPSPTGDCADIEAGADTLANLMMEIQLMNQCHDASSDDWTAGNTSDTKSISSLPVPCDDPHAILAWCDQTLQDDPSNKYALIQRSKAHFTLGQFDEAVQFGQQSIAVDENFHEGCMWTGDLLVKLGRFKEACELLEKIPTITNPLGYDVQYLENRWMAALQCMVQSQPKECISLLQEVVPHATHATVVKSVFVNACCRSGQWNLLYQYTADWLWQPPFIDDITWRYNTAMAAYHGAMIPECLYILDRDPTIECTYVEAKIWRQRCTWMQDLGRLIQSHLARHQFTQATEILLQAIAQSADVPAIQQLLRAWHAQVLAVSNADRQLAISECCAALEGHRYHWSVIPLSVRAKCYIQQQEIALAIADYERILQINSNSDARHELECLRQIIPDLYAILDTPPDASMDLLTASYRRLMLKYHPDKQNHQTDEEERRMKTKYLEIQETYQLLSDPVKRAEYDEFVSLEKK